jgi:hypothetical protein
MAHLPRRAGFDAISEQLAEGLAHDLVREPWIA